jgi:DNA primase
MKVYEGDRGCYCFGCGYSADVIGFVKDYFNLSFIETLKKIDVDFGLCLYTSTGFEDVRKAHYKAKIEADKREKAKRQKQKNETEYWDAFGEWERLKENKKKYAPKTQTEDLHPLFIEAVQKLPKQEYILDILSSKRCVNV